MPIKQTHDGTPCPNMHYIDYFAEIGDEPFTERRECVTCAICLGMMRRGAPPETTTQQRRLAMVYRQARLDGKDDDEAQREYYAARKREFDAGRSTR